MRITDTDGKLDKSCTIAVRQHQGIFPITSRFTGTIPTYLFNNEDRTYLQLFFRKDKSQRSAIAPILSRKDLKEGKDYYSIMERINNVGIMNGVAQILEMSSVVVNNTYLIGDELFMDFRYHSTMKHEMSELLAGIISQNDGFRIVTIGKSRSLRERMTVIHQETPVALIRFSIPLPMENETVNFIAHSGADTIAEVESRALTESGVRVLLYTDFPDRLKGDRFPGAKPVLEKDGVYEAYLSEQTLMEGRRRTNEARIPRIAYFLTIEDGRLMDTTFVPAAEADDYISILMSLAGRENGLVLEDYSPLHEDMWNWL